MASWDELNKTVGKTSTATVGGTSGGWSTLNQQVQTKKPTSEANIASSEVDRLSSIPGLTGETISGVGKRIGDIVGGTFEALTKAPAEKANILKEPNKPVREGFKILSDTINDAGARLVNAVDTFAESDSALKKGVAVGEAGIGILNSLFTPITVPLTTVSHIPVVGYAADAVNNLFGALGAAGSGISDQLIDALPVSEETKTEIRPLANEIGALTAQIVGGKGGADAVSAIRTKSKTMLDTINTDIQHQVKVISETPDASVVEVTTPSTKHAAYSKEMGYEPYTLPDQLPVIKMGSKPIESLPTIEANPKRTQGDVTYEPITETQTAPTQTVATTRAKALKPVEGTGETVTRGLSQGIEAKAIEQRLTDTFGQLPEYQRVSMADQARLASEFLAKNEQLAVDVALGRKAPPKELLPESVLVAVEKNAIDFGDVALLKELATNSRLSPEATTMGQRIRTLAERDPSSPVGLIKEVQDARRASLESKGRNVKEEQAKVSNEIKSEIKKARGSRQSWEEFISQMTCGV